MIYTINAISSLNFSTQKKSSKPIVHFKTMTERLSLSILQSKTLASYQRQELADGRQPSINLLFCSETEFQTKSETNAG